MSPNFPSYYDNSGTCQAVMLLDAVLSADAFNTETGYDFLSIGGTIFQGSDGPQNFDVGAGTNIEWSSDGSVTRPGWRICAERGAFWAEARVTLTISDGRLLTQDGNTAIAGGMFDVTFVGVGPNADFLSA